jgi:hypothetical protein
MANTTNWLNISATSGSSGETILTLSANKNLSLYDKRAEITAYNPVYNISAKTYVTIQSFAPIIELSPAIIGVPDTGGTFELNISANCAWVISFPDLVTSYSTSAGTGNATVTLTVPGTSADTTLVGNIVVTAEGGQMSKTARIEQYGQGVQLSVSHSEILFPDSGAVRYFTVTANCVYDVSVVSGDDWAVVSPQSGYTGVSSFIVTVDGTNTGTTTREGIVRISAPGVTRYIMLYQNPKETRLTAYYNATSTTNPTELYEVGTGFSKAETPDGTVIPGDSYIFPDTGSNRVFYTMTGTNIPANTFSGMSALTSVVIPDNITTIGEGAFRDCVNLTSVTIPDTVTVLPDNCFNGCSSLTAIPISESVTYIGEGCFAGCTGIETVTIPTGVTGIGAGCFSGSGVETIYANSPTPATIGNGAFTSGNLQDIIVPCAFFDAYKTAWSAYEEYMSCQDDEQLYFTTDTSNVKGTGETRTITILNTNIIQNRIGLTLPSDFPSQGAYVVDGNVIYLTYPANPSSTSTRTWTIMVRATTKSGKDLSGSYRITQNANVVYSIPYTADTSTVAATGETRTITIDTSNLDPSTISIGIEGATGVSYTYENGVITVVFPRNNTSGERDIVVTVTGQTVGGTDAVASISYRQDSDEIYLIPYTADTSTVDASGETRYIYIDASNLVASSITISSNGIQGVITSYDSATGIVTVIFPDNTGSEYEIMSATITIEGETTNGLYAVAIVEYEQAGVDISTIPLTFAIKTDGYIRWGQTNTVTTPSKTISYSKNGGGWVSIASSVVPSRCPRINVVAGDIIRFKGENTTYGNSYGDAMFQYSTAEYNVYGNILSMVYGDNYLNQSGTGVFRQFFSREKIHSAKSLILNYGSETAGKYASMFEGCVYLTQTPSLNATILTGGGEYNYMFAGCRSLTQLPTLPAAVRLGIYNAAQFGGMFAGCTGLVTVPSDYLPEIIPEDTERPGWTNLTSGCFGGMFRDCTSLKTAPDLPYTGLNDYCYTGMFSGCTSLTTAPALPATTFKSPMAERMFQGCYQGMFRGCTSLTTAPALPATALSESCYAGMFYDCTGLTEAPLLPATTLRKNCYSTMFFNCSNLSAITCLAEGVDSGITAETAEDIAAETTRLWVSGVSPTGIFTKSKRGNMPWTTGKSGIPVTWRVEEYDPPRPEPEPVTVNTPLTFEIISRGNISWSSEGTDYGSTIEYRLNEGNWTSISAISGGTKIAVAAGDILEFRGDNLSYTITGTYSSFNSFQRSSAQFKAKGNIMSLISSTDFSGLTTFQSARTFYGLFQYCYALKDVSELLLPATTLAQSCYETMFQGCRSLTTTPTLPATTLADGCYNRMFFGCTGLTTAPALPATALASSCYSSMFQECTSLTTTPTLPATSLADSCYSSMFSNCTSLTTAPELPARALASNCYNGMFRGCTSLTTAPVLPVTTLASECYAGMFQNCTSLTTAPALPATTLAGSCYRSMFQGCTSLTQAPELPATTLATNCYTGMFQGCTSLTTAPVLPAATLPYYCYEQMFYGCNNLNYVKCLATDLGDYGGSNVDRWLYDVASSGTFVTPSTTKWWTDDASGIPEGWTRIDSDA